MRYRLGSWPGCLRRSGSVNSYGDVEKGHLDCLESIETNCWPHLPVSTCEPPIVQDKCDTPPAHPFRYSPCYDCPTQSLINENGRRITIAAANSTPPRNGPQEGGETGLTQGYQAIFVSDRLSDQVSDMTPMTKLAERRLLAA